MAKAPKGLARRGRRVQAWTVEALDDVRNAGTLRCRGRRGAGNSLTLLPRVAIDLHRKSDLTNVHCQKSLF
jgi:hypothetical protein